jgi:hypothetical protein
MVFVATPIAAMACSRPVVNPTHPSVACDTCSDDSVNFQGVGIPVHAAWMGSCGMSGFDKMMDVKGSGGSYACDVQEFSLQVECSAECLLRKWGNRWLVVPMVAGPFSFHVQLLNSKTNEAHSYKSPQLAIRRPDAVLLRCPYAGATELERCDGRALPPQRPWVVPAIEVDGRSYYPPGFTINGATVWPTMKVRDLPDGAVPFMLDDQPTTVVTFGDLRSEYQLIVGGPQ